MKLKEGKQSFASRGINRRKERGNMTLKEVIDNLQGMEVGEDFIGDAICAFEDYEFEGETEVIVSIDENNPGIDYQAYIKHPDAPIIMIKIVGNKVRAWKNE